MRYCASVWNRKIITGCITFALILAYGCLVQAGNPLNRRYTDDRTRIFWFVLISDTHIADMQEGRDAFHWYLNVFYPAICAGSPDPDGRVLTINAGDLVNANTLWIEDENEKFSCEQSSKEWTDYRTFIENAGLFTFENFFDLPGNHGTDGDRDLSYYRSYSIQGKYTDQVHHSMVRDYPFGSYHFLGLKTAIGGADCALGNRGPTKEEIFYMAGELENHREASLSFAFGHHPTAAFWDFKSEFLDMLKTYRVPLYGFGHTHEYDESFRDGTLHYNSASLGKSDRKNVAIFAVDNDGLSATCTDRYANFPIVLITAPFNDRLGGTNAYAHPVSMNCDSNPIRALVFNVGGAADAVEYQMDGSGEWKPMTLIEHPLWESHFNARSLEEGEHSITVRAGADKNADQQRIWFTLKETQCDDGVDNDGDGVADYPDDCGCYSPSDDHESACQDEKVKIEGKTNRDLLRIESEAYRKAQFIRDSVDVRFFWK